MSLRFPRPRLAHRAGGLQFLFCLSVAFAPPVHAQSAADTREAARQADVLQRQNLERTQRELGRITAPERAPSGIDTRALMPRIDASGVGPKCRTIHEIVISGGPNQSRTLQRDIAERFSGRCLGVGEIEQILGAVTRDYIERGYITTRAYLPQQDLAGGRLQITVVEGVIDRILLEDGGKNSIRLGNVFPPAGGLLNLRDFEQGIDQVNRLSSNEATLDIQPGDRPGASTVVIRNAPRMPLHASLSADNQGSEATGRTQLGATVIGDSLLGFNEMMLYAHRRSHPEDTQRSFSRSDSFSVVLPLRYATLSLSLNRADYITTLRMPSGLELAATGSSATDSWRLERVMYRDRTTRITGSGTLNLKQSKNWLAGELLAVSSRDLSVLDLDLGLTTGLAGGVFGIDAGLSRGLAFAGSLNDPRDLPGLAPRAQFIKYKLGLSYTRPFQLAGTRWTFSTQATGQRAEHTLYGSEQILIGGIYSVRGFVRNTLSGDHGYYVRNEVSAYPTAAVAGVPLPLRVYGGVDFGAVDNRVADVPGGRLVGAALGVSASWKGASIDVFNARPVSMPDFFQREGSQTWVRLNYAF